MPLNRGKKKKKIVLKLWLICIQTFFRVRLVPAWLSGGGGGSEGKLRMSHFCSSSLERIQN